MQDLQQRHAADDRLSVLSTGPALGLVAVGCFLTVICILLIVVVSFLLTSADGPRALSNDFRVFWAAGQMALAGDFLGVFDTVRLTAIHDVNPGDWMPWLYPPGFLFLVAPLGAVSFATGFAIMTLLSVVSMALAVRPFVPGSRVAWLAFSLAPAYLPILVQGQNGLIWLAGLIAAFAALRDQRWTLAGVFIGLLTLKPQYGVLIPVALLAAALWRTFLVASLTALILAALPTIWTGLSYWTLFIQRLGEYGDQITTTIATLVLAAGPLSLFVGLGLDPEVGRILQAGVTATTAVCVFLVWRSRLASFDTKAASLLIASFLASPVIWHNEAAVMALVALFLIRAEILHRKPLHLALLGILWFGTGLQSLTILVGLADWHFPWAFLVTPVLALCLLLCLRDLGAKRTDAAEPA